MDLRREPLFLSRRVGTRVFILLRFSVAILSLLHFFLTPSHTFFLGSSSYNFFPHLFHSQSSHLTHQLFPSLINSTIKRSSTIFLTYLLDLELSITSRPHPLTRGGRRSPTHFFTYNLADQAAIDPLPLCKVADDPQGPQDSLLIPSNDSRSGATGCG